MGFGQYELILSQLKAGCQSQIWWFGNTRLKIHVTGPTLSSEEHLLLPSACEG